MGDGTGGTEKQIGTTTTAYDCSALVRRIEPSANGATWGDDQSRRGECFAEYGATGTNTNRIWKTCLFKGNLLRFSK